MITSYIKIHAGSHIFFVDLEKAFESNGKIYRKTLEKRGVDVETVKVIKALYRNNKNTVRTNNKESKMFKTET